MIEKVIIDTDPGVDDALAIMMAIKNKCNIIGITTVFGNADIDNTTRNTLKILSIMREKISVYKGLDKPYKKLNTNKKIAVSHGEGGFGGYNIVNMKNDNLSDLDAVSYLIKTLEESEDKSVNIICLGPTTNIAKLSILRPDLIKKIKKIIILGGVINEKGNISKYSEFNVYNDPDALKQVLKIDVDKFVIPINVCRKVYFDLEDFNKINNKDMSKSIKEITKCYIEYYKNNSEFGGFSGGVMYDLLATGFFIDDSLFKVKDSYIEVEVNNLGNIGQTCENSKKITEKEFNCNLITDVNSEKLKKLFFDSLNK